MLDPSATFRFAQGKLVAVLTPAGPPPDPALKLRSRIFRKAKHFDLDDQDPLCHHLLITDALGKARATCRLRGFQSGADLSQSYSAQSYDLSTLYPHKGPILEVGRLCLDTTAQDPDLLRLVLGLIVTALLAAKAQMLIGCSSFTGCDPAGHQSALAKLGQDHHGPLPITALRSVQSYPLSEALGPPDLAMAQMPAMLRGYLGMGAWVSKEAVIDRDLDTLHVFTALDLTQSPPSRRRLIERLRLA